MAKFTDEKAWIASGCARSLRPKNVALAALRQLIRGLENVKDLPLRVPP